VGGATAVDAGVVGAAGDVGATLAHDASKSATPLSNAEELVGDIGTPENAYIFLSKAAAALGEAPGFAGYRLLAKINAQPFAVAGFVKELLARLLFTQLLFDFSVDGLPAAVLQAAKTAMNVRKP